jgi:hypothetical protein
MASSTRCLQQDILDQRHSLVFIRSTSSDSTLTTCLDNSRSALHTFSISSPPPPYDMSGAYEMNHIHPSFYPASRDNNEVIAAENRPRQVREPQVLGGPQPGDIRQARDIEEARDIVVRTEKNEHKDTLQWLPLVILLVEVLILVVPGVVLRDWISLDAYLHLCEQHSHIMTVLDVSGSTTVVSLILGSIGYAYKLIKNSRNHTLNKAITYWAWTLFCLVVGTTFFTAFKPFGNSCLRLNHAMNSTLAGWEWNQDWRNHPKSPYSS